MAIVAIKKLGLATALAVGGGYSGAVCYGLVDEEKKGLFSEILPAYERGLSIAAYMRDSGAELLERISRLRKLRREEKHEIEQSMAQLPGQGTVATREHDEELERLRERLVAEEERRILQQSKNQQVVHDLLTTLKLEQEARYKELLDEGIRAEHQRYNKMLGSIQAGVQSLEKQFGEIQNRLKLYYDSVAFEARLQRFACAWTVRSPSVPDSLLLDAAQQLYERSQGQPIEPVVASMLASSRQVSNQYAGLKRITREFFLLKPIAERYIGFKEESPVLFLLASVWPRRAASTDETLDRLARIEESLLEGSLEHALYHGNQLSGWPRVVFLDWLVQCRLFLEIEQGLKAANYFLLSQKS